MSAEREMGGTDATDTEAAAVLAILFAGGVGDAVRALRVYAETISREERKRFRAALEKISVETDWACSQRLARSALSPAPRPPRES